MKQSAGRLDAKSDPGVCGALKRPIGARKLCLAPAAETPLSDQWSPFRPPELFQSVQVFHP